MIFHPSQLFIFCFISSLFFGCSGSALESDTNTPNPDVLVSAGSSQSVNEQATVALNAQATGQTDSLTFSWSASPGITVNHEDTSVGAATFISPILTEQTSYIFTVVVTDGDGNTGIDSVEYLINPVNILPEATVTVEQVDDFTDNQFPAGQTITLNGSSSSDRDSPDESMPIAAYFWQQTAGESVLDTINTNTDSLTFIAPELSVGTSLSFSLTVTDQEGGQSVETVSLTIQSTTDTPPLIEAGVSHQVFSGETIILNGITSTIVASALPLLSSWSNDSLEDLLINDKNSPQTFAVAFLVTQSTTVTFSLSVTDANDNFVQDSFDVEILPLPIQPLNDTGVNQQASDEAVFITHQADYPGQDGQRGQDVINENAMSAKAGRGEAGFDFTPLDEIGDELDDTSETWSCVRDNITGLIWEAKISSTDVGLHSSNHSYTWFQSLNNGGFEGDEAGTSASCSLTQCNTNNYIAEVNSQGLCNFRDWRLPTHNELLSILHLGKTAAPMIDAEYFPNTTQLLIAPVWFWTQNSSADGIANEQAQNAWAIDFSTGNDNFLNKSIAARVRLVRAGR
jgi:chitinase